MLAVIVGIGSTIFGQFTSGFGNPPTIDDALTLILAALALLGLGFSAPASPTAWSAGGPQLGAGAAVGTGSPLRCGASASWRLAGAVAGHRWRGRRRCRRGGATAASVPAASGAWSGRFGAASPLRRAAGGLAATRPVPAAATVQVDVRRQAPASGVGPAHEARIRPSAAAPRPQTTPCAPAIIRRRLPPSTSPKDHR